MANSLADLPGTNLFWHRIDTSTHLPIRKCAYHHSPANRAAIFRQTKEMLRAGIIKGSDSPWSFPVLLVSEKHGSKRLCIDLWSLNRISLFTTFLFSTLDEVIDSVAAQHPVCFSSIYLRSGYFPTCLDPKTNNDRTVFSTHDGHFEFFVPTFCLYKWAFRFP
jgi:hypothetical protein